MGDEREEIPARGRYARPRGDRRGNLFSLLPLRRGLRVTFLPEVALRMASLGPTRGIISSLIHCCKGARFAGASM